MAYLIGVFVIEGTSTTSEIDAPATLLVFVLLSSSSEVVEETLQPNYMHMKID